MKIKYFIVFVISILFGLNSCKGKKSDIPKILNEESAVENNLSKQIGELPKKLNEKVDLQKSSVFNHIYNSYLIGMEASEKVENTKLYEKYSVDFTAACYSSDLLKMKISNDIVLISNYNDSEIQQSFHIDNSRIKNDSLIIKSSSPNPLKLIIVKVKNAPVYSLKSKGDLKIDIRMSQYVAKETNLEKFGGIDCGDFDG